ncbi:MAG: MT-A70 family methyltransferase [Gammaproteobacteria bacterium]
MTDISARVAELAERGYGDRRIAEQLGITRHQARGEMKKVEIQKASHQALAVPQRQGTVLELYDAACRALGEAAAINDVMPLLDQIEHVKLHARKVRDRQLLADAAAFQHKAERRLGQIILAAREAGHFLSGNRVKCSDLEHLETRATLAEVGVDRKLSARAQKLAAQDEQTFEANNEALREHIVSGAAKVMDRDAATKEKQARRESRERILGVTQLAAPAGKFGVIVEDYEWDHETWSERGRDRAAENHYPVSKDAHTAQEIVERTKDRFACAADDCVCFQWTTGQHLAVALDVMRLRGFDYKSHVVWGKDKIGLGYWFREKHEILLVGVKGDIPAPAPGTQWESLVMAPRGEHSAKPECFLELIEGSFPTLPKIELNRRGPARAGWSAWGFEAERAMEAAE